MATENESEDISDFLLRIRELGDRRDREDEERTRKLEEEILQGRKERQARRAERARSVSPTKEHSNGGTPTSVRSTADSARPEDVIRSPVTFQPPPASLNETMDDEAKASDEAPSKRRRPSPSRDLPQLPSKPAALSTASPSPAMAPSRASTLSWQQRPASRGSTGQRARPLSQLAAENNAARSPRASVEPPSTTEPELSRDEMAESLGSKDPTWFSQTQERGLGSAAYRRDRDESVSDTLSMTGSMRLPGMSRESTVEPERQASPASESIRSLSPSRGGSIRGGPLRPFKHSASASLSSSNSTRSPLPIMNSHIFEPPVHEPSPSGEKDHTSGIMPPSLSQGRISPERLERSPSPTKGLGGFVQSAMLKRSDSVSKRWSAQPGAGLSRGNSIASNRSGYEASRYGISSLTAPKDQAPAESSRETSPVANPRPGSSHTAQTLTRGGKENDRPGLSELLEPSSAADAPTNTSAMLPSQQENTHPDLDQDKPNRDRIQSEKSPPSSPSKRWSPTKSSWLENAINRPDSPKPRMPPPQQPSWMTNLNQLKQQRGATDPGKSTNFKEVSTGGLLRSPPMGAINKPNGISSLASPTASAYEPPNPKKKSFSSDSAAREGQGSKSPTDTGTKAMPTSKPDTAVATASSESISAKAVSRNTTPSNPVRDYNASEAGERKSESPQMPEPKLETPPKKDFRSNLKPRQVSGDRKPAEEAEFKSVFGKLKKTQTQNYVAPNELKDNILRGKAGLSLTGGPKKTERRDEFKESLLKQKEAMKTGSPPAVGRKPNVDTSAKHQRAPGPAVAATEKSLAPSDGVVRSPGPSVTVKEPQPEALARLQHLRAKSRPTTGSSSAALAEQKDPSVNGRKGIDFNSSLAGMLARGPSPLTGRDQSAPKAISQPDGRQLRPTTEEIPQGSTEGPQLTHMTKARARGPKRRLPLSTDAKEDTSSKVSLPEAGPTLTKPRSEPIAKIESPRLSKQDPQTRPLNTISNNHRKPSQPQAPRKPSLNIDKPHLASVAPVTTQAPPFEPISTQPKSLPTTKPQPLSPEIERPRKPPTSSMSHPRTISEIPPEKTDKQLLDDTVSLHDVAIPTEAQPQATPSSFRGAATRWAQSVSDERSPPARVRSPIQLPTRKDEEVAMRDAGLLPKQEAPLGLGITNSIQSPQTPIPTPHDLPTPPLNSPRSPPLPAKKPPSIASRIVSNSSRTEPPSKVEGSSVPQSSEAAAAGRLFAELFDESPNNDLKVNIDTPGVLSRRTAVSEANRIRTLRKQLWEVTAGGKLISVPSDQSHILFKESLYICHHVFGSLSGTRNTEVYLWCGDGVATSAVEDAQIFARKEAKDHGGKLIVLAQGKETANFFQALGGIAITRHGQSDRASRRYMLCGRRHMGQIAFDEVDFSPESLCKGFPYLVSSGSGKLHLWKGSGSGVDELGCARLIGMDLGVRGEIEEVEDGREPDTFWKCFPGGRPEALKGRDTSISKHWQLKPSCERYATRLYRVGIEAPRPKSSSGFMWGRRGSAPASEENAAFNAQIKEIAPFAQSDIFNDGVFVLDTFFELFVMLPSFPSTSTILSTFRTALLFAQEYAILAASAHDENRPFVPVSSVVLFGVGRASVPEGLRMAFRKWEGGKVRGCRVLGLAASIEATRMVGG
ncbi:MAG: hypothetical protein LQ339_000185 [Xanthoria mediterranea]|nr:MAG: hypothetical protein LQ339_000185 [Xanthoria mediterranea]